MFSREYLFNKCVVQHRCIGVHLKNPIIINKKQYDNIFILDIATDNESERETLTKNLANQTDTYGDIEVSFFVDQDSCNKENLRKGLIRTEDIDLVEYV